MRPTPALWVLAIAVIGLWGAGVATGLDVPIAIAAGLAIVALVGASHALILRAGVAVTATRSGASPVERGTRASLTVLTRVPLALSPGELILHLPEQLGGARHLVGAPAILIDLPALAHGPHALGLATVSHADVFGLFRVRTTVEVREHGGAAAAMVFVSPARVETGKDRLPRSGGLAEWGLIPRPYVPGDDVRGIHWKATARTGALMMRDLEPSSGELVVIVVDPALTSRAGELEPAVDLLYSLALSVLETGREVVIGPGAQLTEARTANALTAALAFGQPPASALAPHSLRDAIPIIVGERGASEAPARARVGQAHPELEPALDRARHISPDPAGLAGAAVRAESGVQR